MPLLLKQLDIKTRLPDLPSSVPVFALSVPTLAERRPAIERLAAQFKLGDLQRAEFDDVMIMGTERGDIHYFHASGALHARDAMARSDAQDEMRKWAGMTSSDGPDRVILDAATAKRITVEAKSMLEPLGLFAKEMTSSAVTLEQVAQLDAKGTEIAHGAGRATVAFAYAVEGIPVRGAGAKTLVFAEPDGDRARFTGAFHAWRPLAGGTAVTVPAFEKALAVGLLADPELEFYGASGHSIVITKLELAYLALPAFMRQSHLFPVLQIEGSVGDGRRGRGFDFGRYHHIVPPTAYRKAGLIGQYLAMNPDGIKPRATKKQPA
jgi:hypothetical protein